MTSSRPGGRAEAVDATRGLALLGSAVATAVLWLGARQLGPGYRPLEGSGTDRVVDLALALAVDNRVLAVFALLLGHGLARQLATRARDGRVLGPAATDRFVLRRAALLVAVGAGHAALVLEADVLATLGVVLVLTYPLVGARRRTQALVGLLVVPALLVHGAADGLGGSAGFPDPPSDYLLSVVDRVGTWLLALVLLPFTQAGLVLPALAGVTLARAGWLEDPGAHRRGLLLLAGVGSLVGLVGAWPYAQVVSAGRSQDVAVAVGAGALSSVTGPVGALGAVCLSVLVLAAARGRGVRGLRPGLDALARLGRRSLAVYLGHSVVLALVLAPWAGAAGTRWGSAGVVALGAGVWLVSLLLAGVLPGGRRPGGSPGPGPTTAQPTDRQGRVRSALT